MAFAPRANRTDLSRAQLFSIEEIFGERQCLAKIVANPVYCVRFVALKARGPKLPR